MKKIFILLTSMFLLVGCMESVAVVGGTAANGNLVQSSLQSGASYGIKKTTGKTPLGHAISYVKKENKNSCAAFVGKKATETGSIAEKKIISKQIEKKKEFFDKSSKELTKSIQSSINERSKIKYLD